MVIVEELDIRCVLGLILRDFVHFIIKDSFLGHLKKGGVLSERKKTARNIHWPKESFQQIPDPNGTGKMNFSPRRVQWDPSRPPKPHFLILYLFSTGRTDRSLNYYASCIISIKGPYWEARNTDCKSALQEK